MSVEEPQCVRSAIRWAFLERQCLVGTELLGLSVTLAKLDCATLLTCKIGVISLFIMRDKNQLIHAKCLKQGLTWSKH